MPSVIISSIFLIWLTLSPLLCTASTQAVLIEQCLANKLAGKRLRQVNQESLMHLTLGQYGIETMNALSLFQMRQVVYLADCVAEIMPHLFIVTNINDPHYNKKGGNNVTYINNLFFKILPTIKQHLLATARTAITQSAWKHKPLPASYGIRSAYMLASEKEGLELFIDMIRNKSEANRDWKTEKLPFNTNPILYRSLRRTLVLNKTEEVTYREKFISDHVGSDLTIVVMLSEAKNSCRGDYLHLVSDDHLFSQTTSESEYDDEEEHFSPLTKKKLPISTSSSSPPSEETAKVIDNFTPEKGSILTIRGRYHGPEEVVCGRRQVLVLELWRFQDAPVPLSEENVGEMMSEEEGAILGLAEDLVETSLDEGKDEL